MSETIKTTCPYCGTGCGVKATVDGDQISVAGDPNHPANFGRLCVKGSALDQVMDLDGRLLHPRINGSRANWDEALDLVAQKFRDSIKTHGPDSVAFYVSGQLLTEDYYVANKLMKGFVGSANIDTNSRLCMSSSVAGHKRAFGSDTVPGCYDDLEQADLVVLTGSNLAWCHPILFQRLAAARENRRGKPIVVNIDPRRTATSEIADLNLQLAPGSDVALFLGLLDALRRARKANKRFVNQHTEGLAEALAEARNWTLSRVAEVTGVPPHDLRRFYDLVAAHENCVTVYSQGVNQSWAGADKVNAIINTHLYTGRIGKPGCGPFSVTGQPNAMGGREVGGLANMLAAHMDLENPAHRALVSTFWKAPAPIPDKPGLKAVDLFKAVHDGRIKALWIMATNPVDSLPDADFIREALAKCPFVVVSDVAENTDTNAHAHVLLPALAWGEKDGVVTNSERRISRQRALRPAPGEARADWRIICDVAGCMGFGDAFAYDKPAQIFAEHARLSGDKNGGSRDFDISAYAWISAAEYDRLAPFQWPAPAGETPSDAPKRFFADGKFFTPGRKARFVATPFRAPAEAPSAGAPFVLNTGRLRDQWHTMTRTGGAEKLSQHIAEPFAELNPLDAARLGVEPAGLLRLSNTRGDVLLRAQIVDRQRPGSIFVPIHWSEQFAANARVGKLVAPVVDPVSGQPESKAATVAAEAVSPLWFAFALTREKSEKIDADYWALARTAGGWRIELAGFSPLAEPEDFARKLLGAQDAELTALRDERGGGYRCVATQNDQILGAFYLAAQPVAVARAWAAEQFAAGAAPLALLAGQPPKDARDPGRKICVCLNVGVNTILDAIRDKALISVAQISDATGAGTGCGSCRPEIERLLHTAAQAATV
ncbi:assimilatory nitrate reductase catalytic subunit [Rhodoblastus acidophilus]|uniref:nitrate reductase n=1 Tax=Rhodoblastus acidophilus TaxID=1074 RepID=UPI002225A8FC|nr:nitrate reductase [Rhodoblastus acidophilus]MCW2283253.1 assimilatory nitrate reductase catalytic subunit [Rhodoblastus acidophilus]MCW2332113.1 assimilatory nitrate reductase catalytic subunit [Rhodoblastus acidophilus]